MQNSKGMGETIKRLLGVALLLILMAGCAPNQTFVYKPSVTATGGAKLPVKLAVLPFTDATEDFTQRGSVLNPETLSYNLAKMGIKGSINALTPEYWAKAFADETAASDDFQVVRFVYAESEISAEDYRIEGTVEKATVKGGVKPNEFAIRLRAFRATDRVPVWEKSVSRHWKRTAAELVAECGPRDVECRVARHRLDLDQAMREMFTEARDDLVRKLAPSAQGGTGQDASLSESVSAPPRESVDKTIESILKAQ